MAIKFLSNESIDGTLEVGSFTVSGSGIVAAVGMTLQVDAGNVNAITIDNVGTVTTSGYLKIPNYLFHDGNTDTFLLFGTDTITLRGDSGITLDGPVTANESISITGNLSATGTGTFGNDLTINNSSPEIFYLTSSSSHYNWMLAAQENVDGAFEITPSNAVGTGGVFNTPAFRLDASTRAATFAGNLTLTTAASLPIISVETTHTSGIPIVNMKGAASAQVRYQDENGNNQSRIDFNDAGAFNFIDATDGSSHLLINSSGNVGIGESSPGAKLEINDGSTQTELRISVTGDTGYSTINFADASDINPGQIYYHHEQNLMNFRTNDVDKMQITSAGDIWQLNGANSTSAFAPWDVSYPDEGICINTPSGGTKYLSFADSQTPSYGAGMRYFEASNFTELYTKLAGAYTTHVRLDRASPYTTWLNPESGGSVGIGIATAPLAKLHLEGTGDMIRVVKNANTYGPQMDLILNQTSPSNGDTAAYINMGAKDNSGNPKYWGSIRAVVDNIFTEIGGFEFYTRAASDFSKRLKISAQGKVIVYQKDNVSGFYLDGANTRLYANGGGGTDYRGIECNSSGMWSWGETGSSNFFANKVGIGDSSVPNTLSVKDTGNLVCRFTGGTTFSLIQNNTDSSVIFSANHGNASPTGVEKRFIWQMAGGTAKMKLDDGTLTVSADLIAYGSPSDKRLKENIKPIKSALDKVEKLQGVTFDWKDKKQDKAYDPDQNWKHDIGFIAQDVQKIIPELVRENKDGMLSMRHQGMAPILLEAIKELKAEIEVLKNKPCACNNCNCKE